MKQIGLALALLAGNFMATGAAAAELDDQVANPELAELSDPDFNAAPAIALATVSSAEDSAKSYDDDDVDVSFTPYLWVAGINGNISIPRNDSEADIDKSFADILSDLKFAVMGTVDVNYHRVVVHTDLIYLNVSTDVEPREGVIFTEGKTDAKLTVATAAIGYRVVDNGPMFVDLYAGGRLVALDVDLELTGPLQTRERSASPSNISPLVGGIVRVPVSDRWALALRGNLGFDSDIKWELAGTVQYRLGDHWQLGLGYRHLALHHDKDEAEFDIALSGPLIAFTYKF